VQAILEGMAWLNLNYDEGPFYQTQRFDRYHEVIEQMLKEGTAYRCYCSKERLEQLRETQIAHKEKPRYDGVCRQLHEIKAAPYVIRFKNPLEGVVEFEDLVRGKLSFANTELDDLIIARTDGSPTYNFTVVVDDADMHITHVIRGDDHINNTPRQINILDALGVKPPQYAHLPMILGSDGKRLSKRHGAVSVMQYRDEGFLPQALLNYLVRLGWAHGDQEIFSISELINLFEISNINRASAALNPEKLLWLNQYYMKQGDPALTLKELAWHMQKLHIDVSEGPSLIEIIKVQCERTKTLREMAERSRYFYEDVILSEEMRVYFSAEIEPLLKDVRDQLLQLQEWTKEAVHLLLSQTAEQQGLKLGKLAQPIRVALTGGTVSPPLDVTIVLIGRERVIARLNTALACIS
jgi:glutamyl-tRNA synthetase